MKSGTLTASCVPRVTTFYGRTGPMLELYPWRPVGSALYETGPVVFEFVEPRACSLIIPSGT